MRRVAALLVLILTLTMSMNVNATSTRSVDTQLYINYNGTTAVCNVDIYGTNSSQHLEATIKFWHKNRCLQTWVVSGYGVLFFTETAEISVAKGSTYRLSVDLAIDGDMQPTVSTSRLCE